MIGNLLAGQDQSNLQSILAQINALMTPTQKLPSKGVSNLLLSIPGQAPIQGAPQQQAPQMAPRAASAPMASGGPASGSSGGVSQLLSNPSTLKNAYSAVSSLLGPSLAAYGSGAAADSAVTGALGSVGAQTAGESAAIQAANDAALSGSAAGGSAAGAGAAGGSGAGSGAALGAGAGAATALGLAALPLALAAFVPTGENASWWQGLTNQINNPNAQTSYDGKLTLANDLMNNPGDNPYSPQQLQAWGIPQIMHGVSQPVTTPIPGGWLGGSGRGMVRK